jgi:hypothetical protein
LTASVHVPAITLEQARRHLRGSLEQICFFHARVDGDHAFHVERLRVVTASEINLQTCFHLELKDSTRAAVIREAWEAGAALVEAHLHTKPGSVRFSWSDFLGFEQWVPHVWWRLQGKPYAALVTDGVSWDGLAWVDAPDSPMAIATLESETEVITCSGGSKRVIDRERLS